MKSQVHVTFQRSLNTLPRGTNGELLGVVVLDAGELAGRVLEGAPRECDTEFCDLLTEKLKDYQRVCGLNFVSRLVRHESYSVVLLRGVNSMGDSAILIMEFKIMPINT